MDTIFFPSNYKKALLTKAKNTTIRICKEVGKYKKGKVYAAESYAAKNWGIKIKITEVVHTKLNKLIDFGIPKRSINAILRREKVFANSQADLIRFRIL